MPDAQTTYKMPVITNTDRTYEFLPLAQHLLSGNPNDPSTRESIHTLIYNNALSEQITVLDAEEGDGMTPLIVALVTKRLYIVQAILEHDYFQTDKAAHSDELWALLQQSERLNLEPLHLTPEAHKALLQNILTPSEASGEVQPHPLYLFFKSAEHEYATSFLVSPEHILS
ncbi:MAG: hypothetical protein K0U24_00930 [Gammaproteobacteria bacterium]|nr:hypothetical protein [Gammaproteobacteria bacterium]MCH9762792.1 hypothetical protein [Gammaproteobacteria bacterium]